MQAWPCDRLVSALIDRCVTPSRFAATTARSGTERGNLFPLTGVAGLWVTTCWIGASDNDIDPLNWHPLEGPAEPYAAEGIAPCESGLVRRTERRGRFRAGTDSVAAELHSGRLWNRLSVARQCSAQRCTPTGSVLAINQNEFSPAQPEKDCSATIYRRLLPPRFGRTSTITLVTPFLILPPKDPSLHNPQPVSASTT